MGATPISFSWVTRLFAVLLSLAASRAAAGAPLVAVSASNVTDALANMQGGLRHGAKLLDKLDLTATYTGDDQGHPGLSLFLDLQATDGTDFSGSVVGDVQAVSSIDAPAGARVLDAWIAKDFEGRAGFKAGIIDLNSEFDVQQTAALFLNGARGIGPDFSQSGQNGPSIFPSTGAGIVGWWLPLDHWQIKAGVFEGTPGNSAHPGQTDISFSNDNGALLVFEARKHITPGLVAGAGVWGYTASFDAIDGSSRPVFGNVGAYAILDGSLYDAPEGDGAGLAGWIRVGLANARIDPIDATMGAGLVYTAPFGAKSDQAGISISHAHYGTPARRAAIAAGAPIDAGETSIEATYSFGIGDALILQPDLQYVISPSGNSSIGSALIVGSRITVTW